jgi:hypothetical protein
MAVVAIAMVVVAPADAASANMSVAYPQADTVVVTHPTGFPARKAAVQSLHNQLVERAVAAADTRALEVKISPEAAERLNAPTPASGRLLVGEAMQVDTPIDLRGARRLATRTSVRDFGALQGTRDGGFVWSGVVHAPGASAIRLTFSGFDLPEGAALYLYGDNGQAAGPYTGNGPMGTGVLHTTVMVSLSIAAR